MNPAERVRRNRCAGLRVAALFAIVLAALSWANWPVMGVALGGGLVALVVYLRECRSSSAQKSAQTDTHTSDSSR
jgi:hypothetical protein